LDGCPDDRFSFCGGSRLHSWYLRKSLTFTQLSKATRPTYDTKLRLPMKFKLSSTTGLKLACQGCSHIRSYHKAYENTGDSAQFPEFFFLQYTNCKDTFWISTKYTLEKKTAAWKTGLLIFSFSLISKWSRAFYWKCR
jgi:hypothetical protein